MKMCHDEDCVECTECELSRKMLMMGRNWNATEDACVGCIQAADARVASLTTLRKAEAEVEDAQNAREEATTADDTCQSELPAERSATATAEAKSTRGDTESVEDGECVEVCTTTGSDGYGSAHSQAEAIWFGMGAQLGTIRAQAQNQAVASMVGNRSEVHNGLTIDEQSAQVAWQSGNPVIVQADYWHKPECTEVGVQHQSAAYNSHRLRS